MNAKYCKRKNTYTNECGCYENTAKCPEYWRQGIGSLESKSVSNVTNTSENRNTSTSRE